MKHYEGKKWRGFMPRHLAILREVFNFRFLTYHQLAALLGKRGEVQNPKPNTHLAAQCRELVRAGCLAIPAASRPTRRLQNQRDVFALTAAGARLLEAYATERPLEPSDPETFGAISGKNWEREVHYPFVDHQLHANTILIAVRLTAERYRIPYQLVYYEGQKELRLPTRRDGAIFPDGGFTLTLTTRNRNPFDVDYYLEADVAGNENSPKMTRKFAKYQAWYEEQRADQGAERHTKVLVVSKTPARVAFLRQLVRNEGLAWNPREKKAWEGLLFSDFGRFDLVHPELLFAPIFKTAHEEKGLQMTEPIMPISLG
jgi:hypothetical protein